MEITKDFAGFLAGMAKKGVLWLFAIWFVDGLLVLLSHFDKVSSNSLAL